MIEEEKDYWGEPVTTCAKILAWIWIFFSFTAIFNPTPYYPFYIPIITFLAFFSVSMLAVVGIRKENPNYMFISSIVVLIVTVLFLFGVIALIVLGIALPESFVNRYKFGVTEYEARKAARYDCFYSAVVFTFYASLTAFTFTVYNEARKYFRQKRNYTVLQETH